MYEIRSVNSVNRTISYAYFDDGSIYYHVENHPSMSEGFPSTDKTVISQWIKTHWTKMEDKNDTMS